jgi:hypothetical protein
VGTWSPYDPSKKGHNRQLEGRLTLHRKKCEAPTAGAIFSDDSLWSDTLKLESWNGLKESGLAWICGILGVIVSNEDLIVIPAS